MPLSYVTYRHKIDGSPDQTMQVAPPCYFAQDAEGNPIPTNPTMVGSASVEWTAYIFSTTDQRETMIRSTVVLINGEHGYPSGSVIDEARIELFGAEPT